MELWHEPFSNFSLSKFQEKSSKNILSFKILEYNFERNNNEKMKYFICSTLLFLKY